MRKRLSFFSIATLALAGISIAQGGPVIFSRPLPVRNVNGPVGTRSNLGAVQPSTYFLGDDFSIGWNTTIDSISVWEVSGVATNAPGGVVTPTQEFQSIQLYFGGPDPQTGPGTPVLSLLSSSYTYQRVFYSNSQDYLSASSGLYYPIFKITFSGLNIPIPAGNCATATNCFDFGIFGTPNPTYNNAFALHETDASRAGNVQQGADGFTLGFDNNTKALLYVDPTNNLDANVEITGATPEPSTFGLLALGASALFLKLRRGVKNS